MKKNLIALAVAATMVPAIAAAEGASISGFTDISLTADNDRNLFLANAEVNFRNTSGAVTVGLDVDFSLAGNGGTNAGLSGPNDSAAIEQAFFAWGAAENVTVIAGVINNPIGLEGQDATDINTVSFGQIKGILDDQTALYGNNIAGLAIAYDAGIATVTLALLNDIRHTNLESNSVALVINSSPVEGLNLELGYVTQDDMSATGASTENLATTNNNLSGVANVGSAGNVLDFNATYAIAGATVGLEILTADNVVDQAIGLHVDYKINDQIGVNFRYDTVSYGKTAAGTDFSGFDDTTSTTLALNYIVADNLTVYAEYKTKDDIVLATGKAEDDAVAALGFIATF
ncbi:MAG: hypothetical protein L3J62_09810 [Gammaproteobacteria bacterium]|nr:hypothetical protein [Gammaproteobacteria bacterium]